MLKKYLFNSFSERCIIFIEGKEKPSPKRKDGIKMKISNEELVRIVKDQCERIVTVLKMHAESTTCKKEMESYRSRANGKLNGIIEMAISIYAEEYVNDDNTYWQKVDELRTYENEILTRIRETFLKWYEEHLNND